MIDWRQLFLGFLQGITEFFPISSSGHLFLMEQFLKSDQASLSFVLILHAATLLSVVAVFFKDIKSFAFEIHKKENRKLFFKLVITLLPLFFVGLFFRSFVEQSFEKNTVTLGFFSSGLLLLSLFFVRKGKLSLKEMSFLQAFLIGLAQSVAVLPGFSRSGWTIAMGLYCGLAPRVAVYFSFLISIPAIAGSVLVNLALNFSKNSEKMNSDLLTGTEIFSLSLSFVLAFFVGFLSLLVVLKMVQSKKLYLFSFYLLPLSLMLFLFL